MYKFNNNNLKVFADNVEVPLKCTLSDGKTVTFDCKLKSSCRIKVTLATDNRYMQTVFQCGAQRMCVVNARDKRQPLVFDGFIDHEDESRTTSFVVCNLKELRHDHGLRVREMARAMESPTTLHIFINEAIVSKRSTLFVSNNYNLATCDDDGDNGGDDDDNLELYHLLQRLMIAMPTNENKILMRSRGKNLNNTRWLPVSCGTGKYLLSVNLTFTFLHTV